MCDRTFKVAADIRKYYNIFKQKKKMTTMCITITQRHYYPLSSTLWVQNVLIIFFNFSWGDNSADMVYSLPPYDEDRQKKFPTEW